MATRSMSHRSNVTQGMDGVQFNIMAHVCPANVGHSTTGASAGGARQRRFGKDQSRSNLKSVDFESATDAIFSYFLC